jgi:hypothetical protein
VLKLRGEAVNWLDLYPAEHGSSCICDFDPVGGSAPAFEHCGSRQVAGTRMPFDFGKVQVDKFHAFFVWNEIPAVADVEKVPWHLPPISDLRTIVDGSNKSAKTIELVSGNPSFSALAPIERVLTLQGDIPESMVLTWGQKTNLLI